MSGATGAGPAETGANGARGPAADSQGGTVTDTREPEPKPTAQTKTQPKAKETAKDQAAKDQAAKGQTGAKDQPKDQSRGQTAKDQPKGPAKDRAGQPQKPPQAYAAPTGPGAQRGAVPGVRTAPRTRKARLRVAKADPWSVMKVSFLLSIALGLCTVVAAAVLWMVMDAMGIFSTVGGTISEATGSNEGNGFDLQSFLSLPRVLIFTSVIAVIDVVLMTALATLGSFIYNLSAGFVGGVELTLAEDE
ncbi:DUF3566 domain-containing protein [Streptomyces sp. WAC07061]|uniref:DUF3566 domain-containing protein n=1 Tax=Streptomyces sp. WAC07061 TaxID=2487410 RepID=UPI000F77EC5C|nr:DUF3566 domain-containing protein [Streptomyces sp. WAC07061]RSS57722.1 DUF3566 domain-containing protein [Streptomyces sp. WAC07061]